MRAVCVCAVSSFGWRARKYQPERRHVAVTDFSKRVCRSPSIQHVLCNSPQSKPNTDRFRRGLKYNTFLSILMIFQL